MSVAWKALAASAVVAALLPVSAPAGAADLHGRGGSIKDGYAPMPVRAAGPCYFRADVGYSLSSDPDVRWTSTNPSWADKVTSVSMENTWLAEAGLGCGQGSNGWRGELVLGYRGDRKIDGVPPLWIPPNIGAQVDDPIHTSVTTYTAMANVYRDLGKWGGFVPYVGAGIGLAYHIVDDVYFTGNPFLTNTIAGDRDIAFAWQVMAGVGYQISDRAILDVGYRYADLGKATSERRDDAGNVNPRVYVNDITAHELKIGLRYHFGGDEPCCAHAPMK